MPRNAVAHEWSKEERERWEAAGDHRTPPGAYYFMHKLKAGTYREIGSPIGVKVGCPCGCGGKIVMWFRGGSFNGEGGATEREWDVTGDWPKASMSPSIGYAKNIDTGQFHWHGFLRNGVFEEC